MNRFKYRNKKKIYIIGVISLFILFSTIIYLSFISNSNSINNKNNYKYYNEQRLVNTHQNDNGGKKEKKLQHENYITKKDRKPRPSPTNKNLKVNDNQLDGSNSGGNETNKQQFIEPKITMMSKVCSNGGIGYQNECICPFSYSGDQCQDKDERELCNKDENQNYKFNLYPTNSFSSDDQFDEEYSLPSICCWNKFRIAQDYGKEYSKEVLVKPSMDNIDQQSKYIKKLLNTFGPWDSNDKLLFNYLFKSTKVNGQEEYYLKYSSEKYQRPDFNGVNLQSSNLAFFFLLTDIKMENIKSLFTYLYRSKHYYVIHVDKNFQDDSKMEELELYLSELLKKQYEVDHFLPLNYPKNYKIMKDRFYGSWGSIGLVYPEIAAYSILFDMVEERSLITKQDETWTHIINLSTNDFPVKTVSELEFFLRQPTNINRNFVENGGKKEKQRYSELYIRTKYHNTVAVKFNQSNICGSEFNDNQLIFETFYNGKAEEGSQWHFITYKFAQYIVSDFNPIRRLLSIKFTMIPDELFFQQVRNESPTYPNDQIWDTYNYRFIPWDSHRLSVQKEHIEKGFPYITYFTRKVYNQDVKDLIIKKYLHS